MKITGVRARPYEIQLRRRIADANNPIGYDRMAGLAVQLDTDAGVTGVALSSPGLRSHITGMVEDQLVGRDPRGVRGHWKRMMDTTFKGGNRGLVNGAISAIDIALWDIKAKLNGEPLWKTLGASTRKVRAYASGIELCLSDDELRDYYESMAARGVNAGKLKVGLDLPVTLMNCAAHFMAHVAAALPNHVMMECAMLGRGDGLIGKHEIVDGWITLSDRPGLGIEFDEARLAQLAIDGPSKAAKAGSWARRRGAGLIEVGPDEPEEVGEE